MHASALGGHSSIDNTHRRVRQTFYWPRMKQEIEKIARECEVCIRNKVDGTPYAGLLQPIPIPTQAWQLISMDFIEALPRSEGKDTILIVVDKFTKYAHFIALSHPYSAQDVSKLFLDHFYKLHGMPKGIITDRDKIFTSLLCQDLFKLMGVRLRMSMAYHLQTDGQTERVNRCVETYLRCMSSQQPKRWCKWLPLAEWWYNINYHSSLGMTPFQALYGYTSPDLTELSLEWEAHPEVNEWKVERDKMVRVLRERLQEAQNRMKQNADKKRADKSYTVGEMVFLKLQPYRQTSVELRRGVKLASKIHPVFHVSLLKKGVPQDVQPSPAAPIVGEGGEPLAQPEQVLERRILKRGNKAITQVLVKWSNLGPEDATWEDYWVLKGRYPGFDP